MDGRELAELNKPQITRAQKMAAVNASPACAVVIPVADGAGPDHADAVIGFVARRADPELLDRCPRRSHLVGRVPQIGPVGYRYCSGLACPGWSSLRRRGDPAGVARRRLVCAFAATDRGGRTRSACCRY